MEMLSADGGSSAMVSPVETQEKKMGLSSKRMNVAVKYDLCPLPGGLWQGRDPQL